MKFRGTVAAMLCCAAALAQEEAVQGPVNEKAQKTYNQAIEYKRHGMREAALERFKKADKQEGGHCVECQRQMIKLGVETGDWKTAEAGAGEMAEQAQGGKNIALAHYEYGILLINQGLVRHKDEDFTRAHEELGKALAAVAKFPPAILADGRALAYMKRDDAAKARFEEYVKMRPEGDAERERAERYIGRPELARARLAPAFAVTTTDGQRIAMDELGGKVVLIDFWATWCEPCREALPHMREVAKKFQGQPLVVLSVSLDTDEGKWKEFVAKNEMTWPQYRDAGFSGPLAIKFGVTSIPHTFTIDGDGVLQDEHIGDAAIEGKLKKLVARAREMQAAAKPGQ